ncbi:MAG: hypothetical protein AAFV88_15245 [Planctomycetota bacterium]
MTRSFIRRFALAALLPIGCLGSAAHAHMPWLATDSEGHAVLWFGESPDDRTYAMPESVAKIQLRLAGGQTVLETASVESEDLVGRRSVEPIANAAELSGSAVYGLYHGMKLTYHVEHLPQKNPANWSTSSRKGQAMQTVIEALDEGGIEVMVLSQGEPAAGLEVKLYCSEGHIEAEATTDQAGKVRFSGGAVEGGLNAVLVASKNETDTGRFEGQEYSSSADYLTATFYWPEGEMTRFNVEDSGLAELPEEVTSFGAAIAGETLYVYGGHTGGAHSYSTKEQSNRLWSLDLKDDDAAWTKVSTDDRLQGLAMVAYGNDLIRIGGFTAMNDAGEEQDLQSQSRVARFDAASKTWSDLAPLPEPRSSTDAAVLGDRVYVFGGWKLHSDSDETTWHQTAYSLDLSSNDAKWEALPEAPFQRRALSVAAFDGKLYAIGGMQSRGGPTTKVSVYDPETQSWAEAPALPGEGMTGFGSAAFALNDGPKTGLYVSTYDGGVHRLTAGADAWETVAEIEPARFFHRMVPWKGVLLVIGGANMESGKFTHIDRVQAGE